MKKIVYTIGHSTHPIKEFIDILKFFKIEKVVDIRTIAGSDFNPQFNAENLEKSLEKEGVSYVHLSELGGLRPTNKNSINLAWKNKSFRGYADYMLAPEFEKGILKLLEISKDKTTVIMCAEAVPWRCHRSLVGDALTVRKVEVVDIISKTSKNIHKITKFAKVKGLKITYPKVKEN